MFMHPNTYHYGLQLSEGEARAFRDALSFRLDQDMELDDDSRDRLEQLVDALEKGLEKKPCKIIRPQRAEV